VTTSRAPIAVADREGEPLWFNHDLLVFKATCAQTDGAFILLEQTSQRGKMTPLHIHPNEGPTTPARREASSRSRAAHPTRSS
jgi:hypothetical protein